jgi:hypothetical protein
LIDKDLLEKHGVEMIAPHRCGRKKPKTQDGRKLRHYHYKQTPVEGRAAFRLAPEF